MLSMDDCGRKMTVEESREVLLDLLNAFVKMCEDLGLRYYLSGGTLLGAVRHKGFIPWDDDIDVNMPRPDFEKLLAHMKEQEDGRYKLFFGDDDPYAQECQWGRLYDTNTVVANYYGGLFDKPYYYHPVFLDIFPIDGFPDSELKTKIYCKKLIAITKMAGVAKHPKIMAKNKFTYLAHIFMFIPAKAVGIKRWNKIFQREAKKYDFDKSDYIGVTSITHYLPRERVKKAEYIPVVKAPFEKESYCIPAGYDAYLSQLYGDYMKMPPEDKQKSHHTYETYWKK